MASLAFTFTVPGNAGAMCRKIAAAIEQAAGDLPDVNGSGGSVTLTFDNTANTVAVAGGSVATRTVSF